MDTQASISAPLSPFSRAQLGLKAAVARDLWAHRDVGTVTTYAASVGPSGASVTVKLTPA